MFIELELRKKDFEIVSQETVRKTFYLVVPLFSYGFMCLLKVGLVLWRILCGEKIK